MPTMLSRHELTFQPDYRLFTLRDIYNDAAVDAGPAITEAQHNIAASTGYEIYIASAQDGLLIHAGLEIWDARPDDAPAGQGWSSPRPFVVDCPSGEMRLGDATGWAVGGIELPDGAGRYLVELFHRGRDDAQRVLRDLDAATTHLSIDQRRTYLDEHGAGIERYLLRMWWDVPLPDDEA